MQTNSADQVVVVGSGLAGLATALSLAPLPVLLMTDGRIGRLGSTAWAQGGIACAIGEGDQPAYHGKDTMMAGGGLSDPDVVERVVTSGPNCIEQLRSWGVSFDHGADGLPVFALEGAHSRARILHIGGDRTGAALIAALQSCVAASPLIDVMEESRAIGLLVRDDRVRGVWVQAKGAVTAVAARAVVLATGGIGGLYASTTNPLGNWGSGLRLAARAGARLRDLEFVQFHPTAVDLPMSVTEGAPLPLASEAIRGEGGILVDETGAPVMGEGQGGDLASRDRVARAISARRRTGRRVFLDARHAIGSQFPKRFPQIAELCRKAGIDPVSQPIPVRPAAHYHMGGVETDLSGATDLEGLWAVGEVASTGMHGANRLASNSLLEAIAFAAFVAEDIRARPSLERQYTDPVEASTAGPPALQPLNRPAYLQLRKLMDRHLGVERERVGLARAIEGLSDISRKLPASNQVAAMAEVGTMMARMALSRQETIGAHVRRDDDTGVAAEPLHQSICLTGKSETHLRHMWSR